MADRPSPIRPTDDEARKLAHVLARGARFGAIGVIEPESGHPFTSRVLLGTDIDGVPVMIGSLLSTHTKALLADARCSLLVGEPGSGDPLAWPRLTILATAERIERDTESHCRIRRRFVRRHPKSKLYIDFADFSFFRLNPNSASLNGGFGKAFILSAEDIVIASPLNDVLAVGEERLLDDLEAMRTGAANLLAKRLFKEKSDNWRISGLDAAGIDIARKESLLRIEFPKIARDMNSLVAEYSNLLK